MKFFSKQETIAVLIILSVITVISYFNFQVALLRGRDNERENDVGDIAKMLDDYKDKYQIYPDSLTALPKTPKDPYTPKGYSYLYVTDGKYFQVYASLEEKSASQFNPAIEKLNLKCGNFICNFGKASGSVPLDKSLQLYENELNAKNKK